MRCVFNDWDTAPAIRDEIKSTYDGPLILATDDMVFNITKADIRVRMAVTDEDIWPQPALVEKLSPDASERIGFTEFIDGGRVPYTDVVEKIYDDINKKYGSDIPVPE